MDDMMYVGAAEEFNELGVIAIMQESMRHVLIFSVINDPQASLEFSFLFEPSPTSHNIAADLPLVFTICSSVLSKYVTVDRNFFQLNKV